MSDDRPAEPFRVDWLAAGLAGERRDLAWYLDRARGGDQQAARRAIRWIVESLTPAALAQNGGQLDPLLAEALRAVLGTVDRDGDSEILRIARQGPSRRPADHDQERRIWWACLQVHRAMAADPELSQDTAAARAIGEPAWMEPNSLNKHYRRMLPALVAYEADIGAVDDSDGSPPAFPP